MKKRILAMMLAGALALSLAACGGEKTPQSEKPTDSGTPSTSDTQKETEPEFEGVKEVVVGISADIKSWDPWGMFNLARQNQASLLYQTLTCNIVDLVNGTLNTYYILAESTEQIDDLTYQIKIRPGIVDTEGNAFTAEDAIFSFQTCKDLGKLTQVRSIANMELVDELTFNMTLTKNTVGTFNDICNAICMVTKESYEASPDGMITAPVGTSPMKLASYVSGDYCEFVKADSYWNEAANESKSVEDGYCTMWDFTNIDVIRYKVITDTSTMAIALENGEIDIARTIGMEDADLFEKNDNFSVFSYPNGAYGVAFNASENSPTSNYNLRMAIAHCIDSEGALMIACNGDGEVAHAWSYRTFADYQSKWDSREYFKYDLKLAKDYLSKWEQETGKKASDLKLRILRQGEKIASNTALAVQSYIGELTGNPNCVEIISYDRATFNTIKTDPTSFDMIIINSQICTRTHSCYEWDSYINTPTLGYNIFHVNDDKLQELLMVAIDTNKTNDAAISAFQAYLDDQCYFKNLFIGDDYGATASWIGNLDYVVGQRQGINLGALTYDGNASGK